MRNLRGAILVGFVALGIVFVDVFVDGDATAQELSLAGARSVGYRQRGPSDPPLRKSNQVAKRNTGSAKKLDGLVYIYHLFISDEQSSWSDIDKRQVKQKLRDGYDFITFQSRKHGAKVTFVDEFGPDLKLSLPIPTDAHANPSWTEMAIQQACGMTGQETVKRIQRETNPDNVILCLHVNKPALSYNLAYYAPVSQRYTAERMVCFSAYPDGRETSAATYAHEVLHLFGAGDLYFPYDELSIRKERAQRLFPNDVMYRVDYDMSQLNVGPFTAYRIGWTDHLDPRFAEFEDE